MLMSDKLNSEEKAISYCFLYIYINHQTKIQCSSNAPEHYRNNSNQLLLNKSSQISRSGIFVHVVVKLRCEM